MKTEPTEKEKLIELLEVGISNCQDDLDAASWAYEEGILISKRDAAALLDLAQSSPKIKQLEWVEVNDCGEIGIEAKTPFGDYGIYERSDHDGYTLWSCEPYPYVFDTEIQAKMYAQANFERRVKECLE